ncbi:MAG: DinB family protein [Anaerolineales bacterium]|jgi:hypothetical protein
MKKSISTDQTPENIEKILSLLAETPERLAALTKNITQEQLTLSLGPGERTITEILAHLVNSDAVSADSIYLALLKKEPLLHKLHAERDIGSLLRHDRYRFPELLVYFTFRRKVLLNVLQDLTETQWSRTVREEGKKRRESVYWRARGQALHELEHLKEIEAKIRSL